MKKSRTQPKENLQAIAGAAEILKAHPLFARLEMSCTAAKAESDFATNAFARLVIARWATWSGEFSCRVELNAWRRLSPPEWANVIAQATLHHYFCHPDPENRDQVYSTACSVLAYDFLETIGCGLRPSELQPAQPPRLGHDLPTVLRAFERDQSLLSQFDCLNLNGPGASPFVFDGEPPPISPKDRRQREEALAAAIRASVVQAIDKAGAAASHAIRRNPNSFAGRARSWFIASYPLLASLAAGFEIIEDEAICKSLDISIAAVDSELCRIYINPLFAWTYESMKFAIAHELLHVGLRHEPRRQGRDPYLWNVACDYVINGWLVTMGIGTIPTGDLLLDPELGFERESAEAIYDRIVSDLRTMRRLAKARTMAGKGLPDMISKRPAAWWNGPGVDLDEFYRRSLYDGLDLQLSRTGRGLLPGELVEEIRALHHRPIPWDVALSQWLDNFFPPIEAKRSFMRASRRQSSAPDIPRPVWLRPEEQRKARTFGAVLDTSGSMSPRLLARALGAIASYAESRDVPYVRVMQCDAGVHDMGYVAPETLMGRVEVKGRGGTILQPAVDRLQSVDDFPRDAPFLIITDGSCDVLTVRREHAYLMPEGCRLPFQTAAPRFALETES
ncbi:vWA domain-containing protein [Rhizobium sp. LjRoot254]|uniref:vWA domain-containing protein n=1 Tax=Rhizobium sp. LjRoot254 TaxID=3342297 RepID=UPI003ECE03C2